MELNEYETNLDKFFKLKKKYFDKIDREKQKLITNTELSRKEKRLKFNESAIKCINCKEKGGTIFEMKKDYFRITCGNTSNPCDLNISFKRQTSELLNETLLRYIDIIAKLKEQIIKIKLNYILGFITEEQSIVEFTSVKKEITDNFEIYRELLDNYTNIVNNIQNLDEINNLSKQKQEIILDIKKHVDKYHFTSNISEITEIIEVYNNDLQEILKKLKNLQYKVYYIHSENNENILVKDIYSIKDLEIKK